MSRTECPPVQKCLPLLTVLERVNLSRATVYRMMQRGDFPKARKLGARTVWLETEITDYINNLPLEDGELPSPQTPMRASYAQLLGLDE